MPRVVIVTPGFPPQVGGVETVVAQLASCLPTLGWTAKVLTQVSRDAPVALDPQGFDVERFRDWTGLHNFPVAPALWLRLLTAQTSADVVHVHSFHSSVSLAAAVVARKPFVFTPHFHATGHSGMARIAHRIYDPIATITFRRAALIHCVSEAEARLVSARYPLARQKIRVVPNGVDLLPIKKAEPFECGGPIILMVGRLEKYKRVDLAVEAMKHLKGIAKLIILGSGPELSRLRVQVDALGLEEEVRLLGYVPDAELYRWLKSADLYLSLSEQEAFGLTLVQSAAAGASLLVSDIPAHREVATMLTHANLLPVRASASRIAQEIRACIATQPPPRESLLIRDLGWEQITHDIAEMYQQVSGLRCTPVPSVPSIHTGL